MIGQSKEYTHFLYFFLNKTNENGMKTDANQRALLDNFLKLFIFLSILKSMVKLFDRYKNMYTWTQRPSGIIQDEYF